MEDWGTLGNIGKIRRIATRGPGPLRILLHYDNWRKANQLNVLVDALGLKADLLSEGLGEKGGPSSWWLKKIFCRRCVFVCLNKWYSQICWFPIFSYYKIKHSTIEK